MSVLKLGTDLRNYIIDLIKSTTRDIYYPIGKVYLTVGNEDPNQTIGGTWVKISGGYLYGVQYGISNSSYTGTGAQSHVLTINELPSHNHFVSNVRGYQPGGGTWGNFQEIETGNSGGWDKYTGYVGSNWGHTHDVAYLGVWVWKRTA